MMDDGFWEEIIAGPPITGADALCKEVVSLLDGGDITWIKRIDSIGFLSVTELLALVLFKVREIHNSVFDEKEVIVKWAKQIREAVRLNKFTGLDPVSHSPISLSSEDGWRWKTSLHYADLFLSQKGVKWDCSQIVKKLLGIKREKVTYDDLKIDYLKLIAFFATGEAYGFNPSKNNHAVSQMEKDLQTLGIKLGNDRVRTYLKQAVKQDFRGLSMRTIQELALGLAISLYKYKFRSPDRSLSEIAKDNRKRGNSGLTTEKIRKLLDLAYKEITSKPREKTRIKPEFL